MAEEYETPTCACKDGTHSCEIDITCHSSERLCNSNFDDKRTFSEDLEQHKHGVIWAFGYGEEAAKKTKENIDLYQKRFIARHFLSDSSSPSGDDWSSDSGSSENQPSTSKDIFDQKTPHSEKNINIITRKRNRVSEVGDTWTSQRSRNAPLPFLPWADSSEIWQTMVYKEEATSHTRNCRLFEDPFSFLPRMRAILMDWVMEVCEVYRLRRVTYYLAVDYIDRYLTIKPCVPKHQLQLVGISALFIAAKLEEIYPPKLNEFSYVCDGACSNDDILECEMLLLNTLGWDVNPMTPTGWLNLYMQIHFENKRTQDEKSVSRHFLYPQYSAYHFVVASHLIDLFSLDPGFLLFNYSVIAAGAMYFLFGRTMALRVSGLEWDDLKDCTEYMAVFYTVIRDTYDPRLQMIIMHELDERDEATYNALKVLIPQVTPNEHHTMQMHVIDLKYFEKATLLRLQRMGLRVRKTYVKKNKSPKDRCSSNEASPSEDEAFMDEPLMVMFEIEKMELETEFKDNSLGVTSFVGDSDTEYFSTKSKFTFDEILLGINDCTNKALLPKRLKHDTQKQDVKSD